MYVIKKSLSSVVVLTTFLLTTNAFAMEPIEDPIKADQVVAHGASRTFAPVSSYNSSEFPPEIVFRIIEYATCKQCSPVKLALVCKAWKKTIEYHMQPDTPYYKAWYGVTPKNEHNYQH